MSPYKKDNGVPTIANNDQLKMIIKGLGKLNDQDRCFISSEHPLKYVKELETSVGDRAPFLETKLSCLKPEHPELLDIIRNLLSFNPYFRMTALECLSLPVFDQVRNIHKEAALN